MSPPHHDVIPGVSQKGGKAQVQTLWRPLLLVPDGTNASGSIPAGFHCDARHGMKHGHNKTRKHHIIVRHPSARTLVSFFEPPSHGIQPAARSTSAGCILPEILISLFAGMLTLCAVQKLVRRLRRPIFLQLPWSSLGPKTTPNVELRKESDRWQTSLTSARASEYWHQSTFPQQPMSKSRSAEAPH